MRWSSATSTRWVLVFSAALSVAFWLALPSIAEADRPGPGGENSSVDSSSLATGEEEHESELPRDESAPDGNRPDDAADIATDEADKVGKADEAGTATDAPPMPQPNASAADVARVFGKVLAVTFGDAPLEIMADDFDASDEEGLSPLIGSPAPAFEAQTLDGEPFRLADYRGKVVVLDFWATWCGPCMMAMPQINELQEQLDPGQAVVFGVNQGDTPEEIREALKNRDYGLRHLLDPVDDIGSDFGCESLPMTVVIDADGVVQTVHLGFDRQLGATLRNEVQRLLDGETLYDKDLVRIEREQREQEVAKNRAVIGPINPERLERVATINLGGNAYFDGADGNGWNSPENANTRRLVLKIGGSRLALLKADKGTAETIELDWKDAAVEDLDSATLITTDEGLQIVATATRYNEEYDTEAFLVGLFDRDGEAVWTAETPAVGEWGDQSVAVGDLDGDDSPEIVLLTEHYGRSGADRPVDYIHTLAVYSRSGELLTRRWFDGSDGVGVYRITTPDGPRVIVNYDGAAAVFRLRPAAE